MKKRAVSLLLAAVMVGSLTACGGSDSDKKEGPTMSAEEADKDLDYEYGEGVTFHSEKPVTYTMMFSDH